MCTRLFGLQQLESVFACRENQGMHMTEEQLPCLHLRTLLWGMQLESDPSGATLAS